MFYEKFSNVKYHNINIKKENTSPLDREKNDDVHSRNVPNAFIWKHSLSTLKRFRLHSKPLCPCERSFNSFNRIYYQIKRIKDFMNKISGLTRKKLFWGQSDVQISFSPYCAHCTASSPSADLSTSYFGRHLFKIP